MTNEAWKTLKTHDRHPFGCPEDSWADVIYCKALAVSHGAARSVQTGQKAGLSHSACACADRCWVSWSGVIFSNCHQSLIGNCTPNNSSGVLPLRRPVRKRWQFQ